MRFEVAVSCQKKKQHSTPYPGEEVSDGLGVLVFLHHSACSKASRNFTLQGPCSFPKKQERTNHPKTTHCLGWTCIMSSIEGAE